VIAAGPVRPEHRGRHLLRSAARDVFRRSTQRISLTTVVKKTCQNVLVRNRRSRRHSFRSGEVRGLYRLNNRSGGRRLEGRDEADRTPWPLAPGLPPTRAAGFVACVRLAARLKVGLRQKRRIDLLSFFQTRVGRGDRKRARGIPADEHRFSHHPSDSQKKTFNSKSKRV